MRGAGSGDRLIGIRDLSPGYHPLWLILNTCKFDIEYSALDLFRLLPPGGACTASKMSNIECSISNVEGFAGPVIPNTQYSTPHPTRSAHHARSSLIPFQLVGHVWIAIVGDSLGQR